MDSRKSFVSEVLTSEAPKSQICRKYGISRVTGDKWLKRYSDGLSLSDVSRAPFHTPNRTPPEIETVIVEARNAHPAWGARKLSKWLENRGAAGLPANSTICAILKRNGLVSEEASLAATPYTRFERSEPNELWQTDFKGRFAMQNGSRCHPLTVLDDYSRFSLGVDAKSDERFEGVHASFVRFFRIYGLPHSLLCDNGNSWGTSQSAGFTRFEVFLMDLDILPIHCRPRHPQTQGKDERFNGTLKKEVLKNSLVLDLADAQRRFDAFRDCYNNERPHEALGMDVPASRYRESDRVFPEKPVKWEYPEGARLRKIKQSGYLTVDGQGYFLSEAFAGQTVVLRLMDDTVADVLYRNFRVVSLDLRERCVVSRRIRRSLPDKADD